MKNMVNNDIKSYCQYAYVDKRKNMEIKILNMMLFSKIKCIEGRLSHTNIYKYNNINRHDNNNLNKTQTKFNYT